MRIGQDDNGVCAHLKSISVTFNEQSQFVLFYSLLSVSLFLKSIFFGVQYTLDDGELTIL